MLADANAKRPRRRQHIHRDLSTAYASLAAASTRSEYLSTK